MLNDDGVTAFPTYEQLRPWLASMPCAGQASHETVARALTLLRLTRWLSLVRRRRDARTGRILGNLYVLHDEPLTPFEAMQLDPDYLQLVSHALGHSAKTVQIVGLHTLKEIGEDPMLAGRTLPSRLQVLAERLASQGVGAHEGYPQEETPRTNPKKGRRAFFGILTTPLRNPKQGRNPRQTPLFGIRSRPVQYVVLVLMKYVLPRTHKRRRARAGRPPMAQTLRGTEGRAADRCAGGVAAGRCLAEAGRAGRMGHAMQQPRHPQSCGVSVRHHPTGHPWRVQRLGQERRAICIRSAE
ncbi:STY4528 family pathogenicity island replication protein [Rhodanobacter lindaniclasticus]